MDEVEEIFELFGFEREVDGVEALAAEGCVVHERGERVGDGVAGDAVDAGGLIELLDAVEVFESAGGHLAGGGFRAVGGGGEGEGAAGAEAENAADDAGLAHGDGDQLGVVRVCFEPGEQVEAGGQGGCGGDDFDEIGGEALDTLEDGFGVGGGVEVVKAEEEGRAVGFPADAKGSEFFWAELFGGLDFEVEEGESGLGGAGENVELGGKRALEVATRDGAAAGGDVGDFSAAGALLGEEGGDGEHAGDGVGEGVEAEFEEGGFVESGFGAPQHGFDGGRLQGDADSSDTGAEVGGGRDGGAIGHGRRLRHLKTLRRALQGVGADGGSSEEALDDRLLDDGLEQIGVVVADVADAVGDGPGAHLFGGVGAQQVDWGLGGVG